MAPPTGCGGAISFLWRMRSVRNRQAGVSLAREIVRKILKLFAA
jgi:hypothetical protein